MIEDKISLFFNNQKPWLIEIYKILGFGLLSLLMGQIQFYMPGVEGGSDFREIALIIGVFYFRHWASLIFVSLITSLGAYYDGWYIVTFTMHFFSLIIIYNVYKIINQKITNHIKISLTWLFVVFIYFYLFLLPILVIGNSFMGLNSLDNIFLEYLLVIDMAKFEIVSTAVVSALYLLNIKITNLLKEQNTNLIDSMQKAKESERLKTAFLQNLSHEIRTPMNGILGFSQLLQISHNSSGQVLKYTDLIVSSGNQLLHIVDDIIDASQIETNQIKETISEKLVSEFIDELKLVFTSKDEIISERIIISVIGDSERLLKTDIYKLTRIIYHLIDNALKFSGDKPITVKCTLSESSIKFSVHDDGIGIDKNDWGKIFIGFTQLDIESTRMCGGNGLGLSIVKGFITFLHGKIWLTSELGKGSTFFVEIPLSHN